MGAIVPTWGFIKDEVIPEIFSFFKKNIKTEVKKGENKQDNVEEEMHKV